VRPDHEHGQGTVEEALSRYGSGLEEFCRRVEEKFGPCCIILHGSWARGEAKPWSDLDIVVVSDALPEDWFQALEELGRLEPEGVPIEAFGYRRAHWEERLERGAINALDAFEFGIPLRGRDYFQKLRRRFELMKQKGVAREDVCWYIPPEALEAARLDRERGAL
jgi:hypothetical protein